MKIIYLYSRIEKNIKASGEAKKAHMQVNALNQLGIVSEIYIHNQYIPLYKLRIRLPGYKAYNKRFIDDFLLFLKRKSIDVVYIRKHLIDSSFLELARGIKKLGIKIIYEIPTYPYDKEWSNIVDWPLLWREVRYRNKICGLVDRVVTYSCDNQIFGVKTIKSSNGIETDSIPIREEHPENDGELVLLGVAAVEKWHGYDRIIRGIARYYEKNNQKKVTFIIVGEGAELRKLRKLSRNLEVDRYIQFTGSLHGKQLDQMFNKADIGVGSLGMYRIDLYNGYTLKLREYMARGLPFIYAYNDKLIESTGCKYCLKFENTNEEIDINRIIDFYNNVLLGHSVSNEMRHLAEKYLTWHSQMKPIADYLLGGEIND